MRRSLAFSLLLALSASTAVFAADTPATPPKPGEPTDPKALKTWNSALDWERHRAYGSAISDFRKANKQDGGHCSECLRRAYRLALTTGDYKGAEEIAREMLPSAVTNEDKANVHYLIGLSLQEQGVNKKRDSCFTESCDEFRAALDADQNLIAAHFGLGVSLAHMHQDDQARKEFSSYLERENSASVVHERAKRYLANIDLARAVMAPPFAVTTLDGQHISLDGLAGKVVLIDFWATWCGPCREALPHIRKIAQKFSEQPLVVLSISLDSDKDEAKWKDFVAKNGMTWLQYRDGGFDGSIAKQFGVHAIPATFTIDADGVLEDQHVGDADIEGKLKKLVARAAEVQKRKQIEVAADPVNQKN
ncbi:redoxin domain-containing protein [Occallatibacter riparius]|uniref:Redoxin domain-containing protein n=1 Tax=Occallatibacter riparius TaxID=1002689 RepID=A0A9J7BUX9_9BACT|nr:redoxin domain-containing protein [Occallatibacter riparius]UWZ86471.1 redoxin domain-containing protein [Occallatibacter riparius]